MNKTRKSIRSRPAVSISDLRNEGVFEVGAVIGTSVIFVITEERALLCHSTDIPLRKLDGYCAGVAVARLESGERFREVASGLGVSESDLCMATRSLGYAGRPSRLPAASEG